MLRFRLSVRYRPDDRGQGGGGGVVQMEDVGQGWRGGQKSLFARTSLMDDPYTNREVSSHSKLFHIVNLYSSTASTCHIWAMASSEGFKVS